MNRRPGAMVGIVLLAATVRAQAPITRPSLDSLLARATAYVGVFVAHFSRGVAEERYIQTWEPLGRRRTMRSDFLLVKTEESGPWLSFRDVFEVDGVLVRDHDQRLAKLFLDPGTIPAVDRANQIAAEGARYAMGGTNRTINNPLLALSFLQSTYRNRFRFAVRRLATDLGPNVWIVEFEEASHPTVVRGSRNSDLVSRGRYWIDADSGRVLRTEVRVKDSVISTSFAMDDAFELALPVQMVEEFPLGIGRVKGTATYGRFRRFTVTTDEKLQRRSAPPN
jgi:hypothetical protein